MFVWTGAQSDIHEPPSFSLTGVLLFWSDGATGIVKQTPFKWQDGAWHAIVEVHQPSRSGRYTYATIRLYPAVAEVWRRRHVNPRNEAAAQLRHAMCSEWRSSAVRVVTFCAGHTDPAPIGC